MWVSTLLGAGLTAGCATAPPLPQDDLAAQVRAISARQAELEHKLDQIEASLVAARAMPSARAASGDARVAPTSGAAPTPLVPKDLTRVRLEPPGRRAPAIPTEVALREPDPTVLKTLAPGGAFEAEFRAAMAAISTGDIERGAALLTRYADHHPRDERAPAALFQAGLGLLNFGDPQSAALSFERVGDDYPLAREAPDALIRLAECQVRLKRPEQAREAYGQVLRRYPSTGAARMAQAAIKQLAVAPEAPVTADATEKQEAP